MQCQHVFRVGVKTASGTLLALRHKTVPKNGTTLAKAIFIFSYFYNFKLLTLKMKICKTLFFSQSKSFILNQASASTNICTKFILVQCNPKLCKAPAYSFNKHPDSIQWEWLLITVVAFYSLSFSVCFWVVVGMGPMWL